MRLIKEENIGTLILVSFIGIITILMLTMGLLFWHQQHSEFRHNMRRLEEVYMDEEKAELRDRVERALSYITHQENNIQDMMDAYILGRVYEGHEICQRIYNRYKGSLPADEIKNLMHEALYAVRWDNGQGYYFVFDRQGTMWIHGSEPELEQQNVLELKDESGQYFVRDMLAVIQEGKEGHTHYTWRKPGATNAVLKRSYVKLFEPFDWVIGAGIYMDTAEEHVKLQTIEWLKDIRFENEGYYTIIDYDGNAIVNPFKSGQDGTNGLAMAATNRTVILEEFMRNSKASGGGYTHYSWPKPGTREPAAKIAYSSRFERWGWIINTDIYIDDLEAMIVRERQELKGRLYSQAKGTIALFCGFTSIGFLISILISRFISRRINRYRAALSEKARNMELLHQFARSILSLDVKSAGENAVQFIARQFSFPRVSLVMFKEDMSSILICALKQEGTVLTVGQELPLEDTPFVRFKKHPVPIYRADIEATSGRYKIEEALQSEGIKSTFSVPMVIGNKCIGALNCGSAVANGFSNELRRLLELMTGRLAQIVHNATLYEQQYESKQMLETVMDTIPQSIFWKDLHSVYLGCNRNFARVAGLNEPEEIIGKSDYELKWRKEAADYFRRDDQRVLEGGEPEYHMIETQMMSGGEVIWRDVSKVPMRDRNGTVIGVLGMYEDITERKQIREDRERLITAVEQAAEAIMITDSMAKIQYVNPAFETITGYAKTEVIGKNASILKSNKHSNEFYREMWQTLLRKETWYGQLINRRKDGTLYEEETAISPIKDYTDTIISYVAVKRDITEQVRLQKELRQAQKMEAIGTLAGGIAHDFNNILMALMGYTDLALEEAAKGSRIEQYLTEVLKSGHRARNLVSQILTFSRRSDEVRQPLQVGVVVEEVVKMVMDTAPKTLNVEINIEPGTAPVMADPVQLHQVTLNIIKNAIQAMPDGTGVLSVECKNIMISREEADTFKELSPGLYVRLQVKDTGIGIPKSVVDRIFEPFFTTKKFGEGTGLGLAIVHGIVSSLKGEIVISSETDRGTTVSVYVPGTSENPLEQIDRKQKARRGHGHILFIDDDENIVSVCKTMLTLLGYECMGVSGGEEALAVFVQDPDRFDAVITDLKMPGINGIYLARELLRIKPEIPIVLCTGDSDMVTPGQASSLGFQKIIMKPILKSDLAGVLSEILTTSCSTEAV